MAQYTKLPEAAVQATSFPTFRLSRMISKCLRPHSRMLISSTAKLTDPSWL
jgi:hypothetical protein